MPKFLNKNELVLIMLIIVLFDVYAFCEIALPYIIHPGKSSVAFLLTIIFMTYSAYVYHIISHYSELPHVEYKTNNVHISNLTCSEQLSETIKNNDLMIKEMTGNCAKPNINKGTYISERVTLSVIAVILIMMVCVGLFGVNESVNVNSIERRILVSSPIVLLSLGILLFANVYVPYYT